MSGSLVDMTDIPQSEIRMNIPHSLPHTIFSFHQQHFYLFLYHVTEERRADALKVIEKFPDRVPVIVTKAPKCDLADIDRKKYLVPKGLTVGQFLYILRKRINLPSEKSMYLFAGRKLPVVGAPIDELYKHHVDDDGFLYLVYSSESTFG